MIEMVRVPEDPKLRGRQARAVIYTRVSNDKQKGGKSVAEQERLCREFIARQDNWTLSRVYSDNDESAGEDSTDERAEWKQLEVALEAGEFDYLVVWEPSRATRDQTVWDRLARGCVKKNVMFCANGKVYDPADPDERFILDLFFALARRELAVTRKRVLRTVNSRAEEGMPAPGKAPFGYARIYSTSTKLIEKQVPDERERAWTAPNGTVSYWSPAKMIRHIFSECANGTPPYTIAKQFNDAGIPNPRTIHAMESHPGRERKYSPLWDPRAIRTILKNKAYLGARLHHGRVMKEDRWDPLAEDGDFATLAYKFACQTLDAERPASQRRLLSGLMRCSVCERSTSSSTSNRTAIYRCTAGHSTVEIEVADAHVLHWTLTWLSREDNLRELRALSGENSELAQAKIELLKLRAEQAEWEALAGKIPAAAFANFWAAHEPKIKAAEERVATLGLPPALHDLVATDEPLLAWQEMSLATRREVLGTVVTIRLKPAGRGHRAPVEHRVDIARRSR